MAVYHNKGRLSPPAGLWDCHYQHYPHFAMNGQPSVTSTHGVIQGSEVGSSCMEAAGGTI